MEKQKTFTIGVGFFLFLLTGATVYYTWSRDPTALLAIGYIVLQTGFLLWNSWKRRRVKTP